MAVIPRQEWKFLCKRDPRRQRMDSLQTKNKGTQLTCIDTIKEYQPTKHGIPVRIHTAARGTVYRELRAELKIDDELSVGPVESFE